MGSGIHKGISNLAFSARDIEHAMESLELKKRYVMVVELFGETIVHVEQYNMFM